MKNAWTRNVLIRSARTNAMRIRPGSSPRNWRTGFRCFSGTSRAREPRGNPAGGRRHPLRVPGATPSSVTITDTSTALKLAQTSLPGREAHPRDRTGGDLGRERRLRRRAASAPARRRSRSRRPALDDVARRSLGLLRVERDVDRLQRGDRAAGTVDRAPRAATVIVAVVGREPSPRRPASGSSVPRTGSRRPGRPRRATAASRGSRRACRSVTDGPARAGDAVGERQRVHRVVRDEDGHAVEARE